MNGFITRSMPPVRLPARIFSVISKGFIILSGCIHPWAIYLPMSLKQIISNLLNCVSIFWGEVQLYFAQRIILVHTLGLQAQTKFVADRIFPLPDQVELRKEMIQQITNADLRAKRAAMR